MQAAASEVKVRSVAVAGGAAAASAAAGRVSTSPSPSPTPSGCLMKRKEPPATLNAASADSRPSNQKKSKPFDEVNEEMRLKAYMLVGTDEEAKLQAVKELAEFVSGDATTPQKAEYCRAMGLWGICHLVLMVLHHELAKQDGSDRAVVFPAIRFLTNWNIKGPKQRDEMSRCKGVSTIVATMKAYPNDREIQWVTICWFLNYSCDEDETRMREIVVGGGVPCIVHAVRTFLEQKEVVKWGFRIVDRLCDADSHQHRRYLVEAGGMTALASAIEFYLKKDEQVHTYFNKVMAKLCSP